MPFKSILVLSLLVASSAPALAANEGAQPMQPAPRAPSAEERIVNGVDIVTAPSVVALTRFGQEFCTGTLIGCDTVLTAAHCVCASTGANCQAGGPHLDNPALIEVFTQHGGFFGVSSISVPSSYQFGAARDVAVLKLSSSTNGIAPTPINTTGKPASGSPGRITGFGITQGGVGDNGIKRTGLVEIDTCSSVSNTTHVCWFFENPLGAPGEDSNTCSGDSGGPLFVDFGGGLVVAGVTSGGFSTNCLPLDESFDADVFANRTFIQNRGGADLANTACGTLSQAGTLDAPIFFGAGTLNAGNPSDTWVITVPANAERVRFTLNGEDGLGNDFDLYVKLGSPPTTSDFDCQSFRSGTYEACEFASPQGGDWYVLVNRFSGAGDYQTVATEFLPPSLIFTDGFESGDTAAWSSTVP